MLVRFALIAFFWLTTQSHASELASTRTVHRLSTEEGLSQAGVSGIIQDKYGYVWIATHMGLNRYDGDTIAQVQHPVDFATMHISYITLLDSNTLFVSTAFNGAYLIDVNTLNAKQIFTGKLLQSAQATSEISAAIKLGNTIYVGIDNFLYRIELESNRSELVVSFTKHSYLRALLKVNKQLLIGTDQGLFAYNLESKKLVSYPFLPEEDVNSLNKNIKLLKVDPSIGLLVGTVQGLYVVPIHNDNLLLKNAYTLVSDLNIWDHVITPFGELIATELGLFSLDRKKKSATKILSLKNTLYATDQASVTDLMFDSSGNVWMATLNQGAYYWPILSQRFSTLRSDTNNAFNNYTVWSILETADNHIWLGTDNGLMRFESLQDTQPQLYYQNTDRKAAYASHAVYNIFALPEVSKTQLYIETTSGIRVLNTETGAVSLPEVENDNAMNPFKTLTWGGTAINSEEIAFISQEGFYSYNAKSKTSRPLHFLNQQVKVDMAYKFMPPLYGDDYLLSTDSELLSFNEHSNSISTLFQTHKSLGRNFPAIDSWAKTQDGAIWVAGSSLDISAIDMQSLEVKRTLQLSSKDETLSVYQLQADHFGYLWISTQSGLFKVNIQTNQIDKFDSKHGLPSNEFNAGASTVLESGQMIFGTVNGAVWFSPADFIERNHSDSKLAITDISLMSRTLAFYPSFVHTDKLILNHDDLGLKIKFNNFDFANQLSYQYHAYLDGPTSITFDDVHSNYLFFNQLLPGEYTLRIEQVLLGNNSVHDSVSLKFSVIHAPLNSPIAWAFYLVIGASMLIFWFRTNKNRQRTLKTALDDAIISKQQTDMALKTTLSGTWQINVATNTIQQNRNQYLACSKYNSDEVSLKDYFDVIHPEDQIRVQKAWQRFIEKPSSNQLSLTYRVKSDCALWLWYHDIGQVLSTDEQGKAQTVIGIYTNVTEQKATDLRAAILGEAFSQVNDWLLILSSDFQLLAVNASFCRAFELQEETAVSQLSYRKFLDVVGKKQLTLLLEKIRRLKANKHIRQELTVKTSLQNAHPIHLSINAISKDNINVDHYVIVISDLTEQKQAESELRYLANFDALTKLPNRNLMLQHIEFALHNAQNKDGTCAVLFIDLDKFKPINDAYGHHTGDQLLVKITQRISQLLPSNSLLGRQSGDEFLVLVNEVESPQNLSKLATLLLEQLPNKIEIDGISMSISASIGVAMFPFDAPTPELLIRNADIAMIHAKQAGRNGFKFFTSNMNTQFSRKLALENALKTEHRDGSIYNHYQPIVNIITGRVVGVELLMRWQHNGELIPPYEFIPICEEVGLIETMTEQALRTALEELAPLLKKNGDFYLSLNLSPVHILRSDIAGNLVDILDSFGLDASTLRLEITESSLIEDTEKAKQTLVALKQSGFVLLLDDFGTGYSSLTYLSQFPIDIIKIDQGFVRKMDTLTSNKSIIKTIYLLAESLHMSCIAEGVENKRQLTFLRELGCHYMQGYFFSKPVSAQALMDVVKKKL